MAEPRLRHRSFTWAPRTLAVISCALALLALQPMAGGASASVKCRPMVLREGSGGSAGHLESVVRVLPRETGRAAVAVREESFLSSARRLHILATVEILQRWLVAACVGVVELPMVQGVRPVETGRVRVLEVEREFTMGHCQLAPPIC